MPAQCNRSAMQADDLPGFQKNAAEGRSIAERLARLASRDTLVAFCH